MHWICNVMCGVVAGSQVVNCVGIGLQIIIKNNSYILSIKVEKK